ncbi:MAG: glycosyltransferase family 2 protein [Candidatus Margulisbacteria bacterium]|nr:glycosyltransferase family 2 protein [Candidatus Margulisiibacteriota bacterium]
MADLSIVIVSWNVSDLLKECLASIYANQESLNLEVFVVDNNSQDNTCSMVKKEFPQVQLIENKENLGFTRANNQAIRKASSKYIFVLNPDTIVQPQALSNIVKFMEEHPDCGALGPKLLNPDGTLQLSCRSFPTLKTQLYTTLFLDNLFPKSKLFGKHLMSYWPHNEIKEIDQPMGAAILLRKETLDQVGLFDENIFVFYDEVDLCYRIKKAGFKIMFTPAAQITHYGGQSFKQWKGLKSSLRGGYIWRKSRNYFFKKHYGFWTVSLLIIMDIAQLIIIFGLLYLTIKMIWLLANFVF